MIKYPFLTVGTLLCLAWARTAFGNSAGITPIEVSAGIPVAYFSTHAPNKSGGTYSLFGFMGEYTQFFSENIAITISYEASLNSLQGARLMSGPSIGLAYFFLGNGGYHSTQKDVEATVTSQWRLAFVPKLAQRSFDFSSLFDANADNSGPVLSKANSTTGDFWGWSAALVLDYGLNAAARTGVGISYFQSTSKDSTGLSLATFAATLRYTAFIRLGSPDSL